MESSSTSRLELLRLLREALRDPSRIGDVAVYKSAIGRTRARPEIERQLDAVRHRRPTIELDALLELPSTTFGAAYARFMRDAALRPFTISDQVDPELVVQNAFTVRYALVHDMIHVLLGFDTTWPGEVGVWAFVGRQRYSVAFQIAGVLALLFATVRSPLALGRAWRNFRRGRALAQRAAMLVTLPLEDRFEDDLVGLRAELGVG